MLILVDSNEEATNPKTIAEMRKHFPKLQVTSLAFGDVNVVLDTGDILAIERKAATDFLGSIGDGRLFRQVESMANNAKFYCVIVVGGFYFSKSDMTVAVNPDGTEEETNWKGVSVRGALHALQWSACPVLFTASIPQYPFTIMEAVGFVSKPTDHVQRLRHTRIVTFPPVDTSVEILASFPGIGIKRAQALMDYADGSEFKSLAGALAWGSVLPLIKKGGRPDGWGEAAVANFRTILGLKANQYLQIKEDSTHASKAKKK